MLSIFTNRTYRHLFAAQVIALIGTGLATVALGLLAFDLAGNNAGVVMGTALAIKMLAYVGIAPIAAAFAERLPKRTMLVTLDVIRAGVALLLPFVSQIWEVYVLIFVLQSASAAFTPTFQATIPDVLPDEADYTKALSLSRLAYDMESLVSPMLAAALLTVMSFHNLFTGTVLGFLASAILVVSVTLPAHEMPARRSIYDRTTRGIRIYLATPRLRGLLAVNVAVSAAASMVFVNTVVIIQGGMGLTQSAVALALASFGAGSMIAALALPSLLGKLTDRRVMLSGVGLLVVGMFAGTFMMGQNSLMALWFVLGLGYSAAQTPSGRLLWRSSHQEDRPALFAAQFALSHVSWLVFYPLAGWLGARYSMTVAFTVLGSAAALSVWAAFRVWPSIDLKEIEHEHANLPEGHAHATGSPTPNGIRHTHPFIVDDYHPRWPSSGR
ncbi:MFS transporter (plasmid) [Psychrobacter sp. 4Dc]|uniref:MFS transporter n=1 Tax=Psychrobacter sp. 4Dc TaxID=888437 RepID=UPI000CBE3FF7|nr:MFS transporter [Psychrobacter sp. 4Dc]PKH69341.1 MFS transporter [Psychrobacter sp. 4Dc]